MQVSDICKKQFAESLKHICVIIISWFLLTSFSQTNFQKDNATFIRLLNNIPIAVVAPSSGIDNNSLSILQKLSSLTLIIPTNCFDETKTLFHSNSDRIRFTCLKNALFDESTKVVWTLRGGYGAAKLIPSLKKLSKPSQEKFFIGFSDITALHIFLSQEWGWTTIHGNCISEMRKPDKNRSNFIKIAEIISGKLKQLTINNLIPINSTAKNTTIVRGRLTGGNLTIVQTSIGTIWQIKTADKILFLEDIGIRAYQLDRALYHLKQAGLLDNISAIIFGTFTSEDKNIPITLSNFASTLTIPVFSTNQFGHEQINNPIIYNIDSKIIPNKSGTFNLIMQVPQI